MRAMRERFQVEVRAELAGSRAGRGRGTGWVKSAQTGNSSTSPNSLARRSRLASNAVREISIGVYATGSSSASSSNRVLRPLPLPYSTTCAHGPTALAISAPRASMSASSIRVG